MTARLAQKSSYERARKPNKMQPGAFYSLKVERINYLLTESEVFTGKSRTKTLLY